MNANEFLELRINRRNLATNCFNLKYWILVKTAEIGRKSANKY